MGEATRPQRLRLRAAEESRRGEGDRPEADRDGAEVGESQSGVTVSEKQEPAGRKSRGLFRIPVIPAERSEGQNPKPRNPERSLGLLLWIPGCLAFARPPE